MRLITQTWNHTEPSETDQQHELQLLTIGGVSVMGRWQGAFGEYFVGWARPAHITLQPIPPNNINAQPTQRSLS